MFGNKKRDKMIDYLVETLLDVQKQLDIENLYEPFTPYGTYRRRATKHPLVERLLKLEEYLGIEYQEKIKTTKGYVKKNLKANSK